MLLNLQHHAKAMHNGDSDSVVKAAAYVRHAAAANARNYKDDVRTKNSSYLATLLGHIEAATSVLINPSHLRHHVHQDVHRLLRIDNQFRHVGN